MAAMYKIRYTNPETGKADTYLANGYLKAKKEAKRLAAQCKSCALIYVDTPDGWKLKNTVNPEGRLIKNDK